MAGWGCCSSLPDCPWVHAHEDLQALRCCAGWHEFSDIHPNAAHEGLARLQQRGWVDALITQNVDRLHQKAGATDVIELHGTTHRCASFVRAATARPVHSGTWSRAQRLGRLG